MVNTAAMIPELMGLIPKQETLPKPKTRNHNSHLAFLGFRACDDHSDDEDDARVDSGRR